MTQSERGHALARPLIWGTEMTGTGDGSNGTFVLPAGTVTFLLSDIEGSTRLWEAEPEAMAEAVREHYEVLAETVARHGGVRPVEQGEGDSVVAAFARGADALAAALAAQRALHRTRWPGGIYLKVRIALHTADAQLRDEGNYFGVALSRCARLRAIAHGGQTVLSRATHDLVVDRLPDGAELVDCGAHRLRDLGRPEHVYALAHPELPVDSRPLRSLDAFPNNLPDKLTSFVGREQELDELREALRSTRLLTLTGAGGCGKTRLALQAAADALDGYPDGTWWLELASLADQRLVPETLADALDVRPMAGTTALQAACTHLAARRALIVLDNCEHLLEACAEVAESLLHTCPEVTVLATSRAPLGVGAETDWRVPSLSLPSEVALEPLEALTQFDAVRLFIDRAKQVRPNFAVTDANAPAVAQVCLELDGIPLAIELAAARVRVLSVDQIADALTDRFRLLTGGARAAVPRQQTLRASVDWSHELLSHDERTLFRRLAAFTGGFTLGAAEAVCTGDRLEARGILDLLTSLVDKSLVLAEERGPAVRYRLLETVRQFALERLLESGEADAVRDRHRDAYLELSERIEPELQAQLHMLDVLDADAANLTAAVERAIETEPELALRICSALTNWWKLRGMFVAAETGYGGALAAAPPEPTIARARALWGRAYLLAYAGQYEMAIPIASEAYEAGEAVSDQSVMARALDVVGTLQLFADPIGARPGLERSRELASAAGDDFCFADATQILAYTYFYEADYDRMVAIFEEAVPVIERTGYREFVSWHWIGVGSRALPEGDLKHFEDLMERAVTAARDVGEPVTDAVAMTALGELEVQRGDPEAALARLLPTRERIVAAGGGMAMPGLETVIAWAYAAMGDLDEAGELGIAALPITANNPFQRAWLLVNLAHVLRLDGDVEGAGRHALRALEAADAIRNIWLAARARHVMALVRAAEHDWSEAESLMHEALTTRVERGYRLDIPESLEGLAEVAAALQSHEEAARLLAAATRARDELGTVPIGPEDDRLETIQSGVRDTLGQEAFAAAWAEGAAMATDEAVAWARRARGARKRPPGGWESLTPTELQVVELAAGGLTNPEIGERMFITRGTVKTHLSHIYAKLGLKNRAELAAGAARRGSAVADAGYAREGRA